MTTPPQAALLSESEIVACIAKAGCIGTVKMSYESGPYDIDRPSINASRLYDAIEAAILAILAKLQATQAEPTIPGLTKEQFGYALHCAQVVDAATSEIARLRSENAVLNERLDATQEPVQAGELPALPHDGWPARFRCDSCDGNGEIGELISMGHFQPPERQTCPDCGGRGWSDEGSAFNADHMRDYARAALSARKPLNSAQIRGMAIQEEFLLVCDSLEDLTCIVREVERAHGIGLEVKP